MGGAAGTNATCVVAKLETPPHVEALQARTRYVYVPVARPVRETLVLAALWIWVHVLPPFVL
jgi:hypothetical protein